MDRETLSQYGWIVICVLVLAVLIAFASPFGTMIKTAVEGTVSKLTTGSNTALEAAFTTAA